MTSDISYKITNLDISKKNKQNIYKVYEVIDLLLHEKCRIFGGASIVFIKREKACEDFRIYCNENSIVFSQKYNDPTCHPQTYVNRNLLPNDIDVLCHTYDNDANADLHDNDRLKKIIFELKKTFIVNISENRLYRQINGITLSKLVINTLDSSKSEYKTPLGKFFYDNTNFTIKIDMVCSMSHIKLDEYISFKPDFLCNQIHMTLNPITKLTEFKIPKHILFMRGIIDSYRYPDIELLEKPESIGRRALGIRNSYQNVLFETDILKKLIEHIETKKAYAICPDTYRINKMISEGWDIIFDPTILTPYYNKLYKNIQIPDNTYWSTALMIEQTTCPICIEPYSTDTSCFLDLPIELCMHKHYAHIKCFANAYISQNYQMNVPPSCCLCRNEYTEDYKDLCKMIFSYTHYKEQYALLAQGSITAISHAELHF
jgi:hypothetical protein